MVTPKGFDHADFEAEFFADVATGEGVTKVVDDTAAKSTLDDAVGSGRDMDDIYTAAAQGDTEMKSPSDLAEKTIRDEGVAQEKLAVEERKF